MSIRPMWQLPAVLIVAVASVRAQPAVRSGEELYVDRLGCWNCHGKTGSGGAGPSISNSQLPLRVFVRSVRLPRETMPRFAPALASDADLAAVYRWLDGKEVVASPPTVLLGLKASAEAPADGQPRADTEVEVTAKPADAGQTPQASLRYRVTLAQATAPVANRPIQYRAPSSADWATFTTDDRGEATLGPDRGFVTANATPAEGEASLPGTRLRVTLTPGRYALIVEALEDSAAADPRVVGLGTAILNVP